MILSAASGVALSAAIGITVVMELSDMRRAMRKSAAKKSMAKRKVGRPSNTPSRVMNTKRPKNFTGGRER